MALSDRKMPIIEGINDAPSITGNPSHPNGALMCQKYNALIDNELTTIQNNLPATTDDLTEGTTNKYFSGKTTDNLTEGTTNKYYTDTRFDTRLATKTTDNLAEGTNNKYFTNTASRASISLTAGTSGATYNSTTGVIDLTNLQAGISDLNDFTTDDLVEGTTNKYYSSSLVNTDFDTRLATKTTDNLAQGTTNKYFSNALARDAISVTGNGSYNSSTGIITISNADISIDHITKTNTSGLVDTYTIYGDVAETIIIDTFTVTNGATGATGAAGTSINVQTLTQAAYNALGSYNSNTFYVIIN